MEQIRGTGKSAGTDGTNAAAGRQETKESHGAGAPRSWRAYIEQTMDAGAVHVREPAGREKQRRRDRARPAQAPAQRQAAAGAVREPAARLAARTVREEGARRSARPAPERTAGQLRAEQAAALRAQARTLAAQTLRDGRAAAEAAWEKACNLTAEGWDRAGRAAARAVGLVARHPVSPLLYVTLLVVVIGIASFKGMYARAYVLNVNGQEMGVVSGRDEVDAIVSSVESRASHILGERYDFDGDITLAPIYAAPEALSDTAEVEQALFGSVGALVEGYGLRVDGVELDCYAASKAQLYQLLDEAAQPYVPRDAIRYDFVEDVEVYAAHLPASTAFDLEGLRAALTALETEEAVYVVEQGDTFNAIAYSLDMLPNELSVLNPDVIVDKLWVGQELVVRQAVPFLSVQATTDETYEEAIPSPVEYIETAELYVGDTRVRTQGQDGLALVNAQVTYLNGVEMGREVLQSTTLKEATTTYTDTGTTPRPVTASNGYYIWPVRGSVTSGFGGRYLWGSYDFHLGLDIACPTGTGIKAADGGTVITAGWSGSYGNLVAIRHDNGNVTYYAHNSSILVGVGQKVYQGQIIARAGMTGSATGPHCHFEIRINGTSVNPRNYLR